MTILFVSNLEEDAHLVPVAAELGRRGHEVRLFNPGLFPTGATITAEFAAGTQRSHLLWEGQRLDLADVTAVWYRRPGNFQLPEPLLPAEAHWLREECGALVRALWDNLQACWVSDPHAIRRANHKLLQLRLAGQLGFRIPASLVTNDPSQAANFIAAHPDGVIVKSLAVPTILTTEGAGMVYTHRVTESDLAELDSVRHGPTFFQEFIAKRRDVRVTVFGDRLFAVAIDTSQRPEAAVDFRRAATMDLPHHPIDLPGPVGDACVTLVRQLGLRFGAIDLLLTPENDYVFLEINPNGQWLWIELMTDLPLTCALCDLLAQDTRPSRRPIARGPQRGRRPLELGSQTLTLPPAIADASDLAGTRVWLERSRGEFALHVGDLDSTGDRATNGVG